MAFPDGRTRKVEFTVGTVSGTLTDLVVLLTRANLPAATFDADGPAPAQNGGGDWLFYADEAGTTRLACDVRRFVTHNDPASGAGEIHVRLPSAATGTKFWGTYNTPGTDSQPAVDAAYGSEAVYPASALAMWHMDQDPSGSAPQMLDSTSNDKHATSAGSMTAGDLVDAAVGKALNFDGSNDTVSASGTGILDRTGALTLEIVFRRAGAGSTPGFDTLIAKSKAGQKQYMLDLQSSVPRIGDELGVAKGSTTLSNGVDYHLVGTYSGNSAYSGLKLYVNGVQETTSHVGSFNGFESGMGSLYIASKSGSSEHFNGHVSLAHIANTDHSAAWAAARHATLLTPATFITSGTPYTAAATSRLFPGPFHRPLLTGAF